MQNVAARPMGNRLMSAIARAVCLPLVGISAALLVLYFWGPSVDDFYQRAWSFAVASCVVAAGCMWIAVQRLPAPGSIHLDLSVGIPVAAAMLIPGAIGFGLMGLAYSPLPLVPGLVAASLLFPRGKRVWIAPLWLVAAALFVGSVFFAASTADSGANSSEGVGMTMYRTLVWVVVLLTSVIVSAAADWRMAQRRGEELVASAPTTEAR